MKHIVLFRFEEGFFDDAVVREAKDAFAELSSVLPDDIGQVEIRKNCVERDGNFDLAVMMELKGEASLNRYLNHPAHIALVKRWLPVLHARASFDSAS